MEIFLKRTNKIMFKNFYINFNMFMHSKIVILNLMINIILI